MLKRLCIRNYVLIDSLDTEFPEGLIIITGQTGAGKSILLGALSLLLGARADASVIGEASDNCVVEGDFETGKDDDRLRQMLEDNDVDWNDGRLTIRRVVNPSGRSRSFVNDSPVSVQLLSSLSSGLVDIHSQHQTLLLSDKGFQMSLLDHFAGNAGLLSGYRVHFRKYCGLVSELEQLEKTMAASESEYDYKKSRLERLVSAGLHEGELEALELEQKQLANAEEIKECLCAAENLLDPADAGDRVSAVPVLLREASRNLDRISGFVPSVSSLSERLESSRLEIEDIISELSEINSGTEVQEGRLEEVEERLSLLYLLLRAFSCSTVEELISVRDDLSNEISGMAFSDERREELQKQIAAEKAAAEKAAAALSDSRRQAAAGLSEAIKGLLASMELADADFRISLTPAAMNSDGADTVLYGFSSTGRNLADISKCASGGEMSRIMLALKAIMAKYTRMPSMIFDEIDTGVSGSVADKMGTVICGMGNYMQVFAITHLPQVAAKGTAHYVVSKNSSDGRTVSEMKRLSHEERVLEIARMLSGSVLTEAAIANARALLLSE